MMSIKSLRVQILITILMGLCLLMFVYPAAYLEAAIRGLAIWWDVLFPSLFPFFIISEVLLGIGIVHLIGTLLDPFMKPIFRIPGSGGFVAAMGYVSGYPIGAKLTAQLWEQKMINRDEGERLVAFTTSSDPIFLIGAVSIGFFHNQLIVPILAIAHYGGGFLVGILMRYHGARSSQETKPVSSVHTKSHNSRLRDALRAMHKARRQDGRNVSELLQQAIQSSLHLIIVVGGLVVFFSVFLELLTQVGVMKWLYLVIEQVLSFIGMPPDLSKSLVGGIFEVTLGARYAGEPTSIIPLSFKVTAAAFILSWGGLSVHAQIASILHSTNLRYWPFLVARLVHGIIAACIVQILWVPLAGGIESQSTLSPVGLSTQALPFIHSPQGYMYILCIFVLILFAIVILSVICTYMKSLWMHLIHTIGK
ncbi:sporulation integral membrane protein YlbJ [Paenibacillus sp. FA6]|uniref:sporulation integral membrane protein YlbJ n=1 Tax=Paenibacillus sp. FA6 TaxID=3413029 RepID=UPI003F65E8AD